METQENPVKPKRKGQPTEHMKEISKIGNDLLKHYDAKTPSRRCSLPSLPPLSIHRDDICMARGLQPGCYRHGHGDSEE